VYSDTLLSGGLSIAALAGDLRLYGGSTLAMTIAPTSGFIGLAGQTTPLAPLDIGTATATPADATIFLRRVLNTGATSAHGITIDEEYSRFTGAYAAFDDRSEMLGTGNFGHHRSFQARPEFDFTGTMTFADGFWSEINGAAAGAVITTFRHFTAGDDSFSGSLGTQYGLYVATLTAGTVDNWGIWVQNNKTHLGGPLEVSSTSISFLGGLPAADPGIPGRLYHTAGAVMISL
jgi:hypothetical protein